MTTVNWYFRLFFLWLKDVLIANNPIESDTNFLIWVPEGSCESCLDYGWLLSLSRFFAHLYTIDCLAPSSLPLQLPRLSSTAHCPCLDARWSTQVSFHIIEGRAGSALGDVSVNKWLMKHRNTSHFEWVIFVVVRRLNQRFSHEIQRFP